MGSARQGVVPGRPGRHEGHVAVAARQGVDDLERAAGRQQGRVPRSRRGDGVGVDAPRRRRRRRRAATRDRTRGGPGSARPRWPDAVRGRRPRRAGRRRRCRPGRPARGPGVRGGGAPTSWWSSAGRGRHQEHGLTVCRSSGGRCLRGRPGRVRVDDRLSGRTTGSSVGTRWARRFPVPCSTSARASTFGPHTRSVPEGRASDALAATTGRHTRPGAGSAPWYAPGAGSRRIPGGGSPPRCRSPVSSAKNSWHNGVTSARPCSRFGRVDGCVGRRRSSRTPFEPPARPVDGQGSPRCGSCSPHRRDGWVHRTWRVGPGARSPGAWATGRPRASASGHAPHRSWRGDRPGSPTRGRGVCRRVTRGSPRGVPRRVSGHRTRLLFDRGDQPDMGFGRGHRHQSPGARRQGTHGERRRGHRAQRHGAGGDELHVRLGSDGASGVGGTRGSVPAGRGRASAPMASTIAHMYSAERPVGSSPKWCHRRCS